MGEGGCGNHLTKFHICVNINSTILMKDKFALIMYHSFYMATAVILKFEGRMFMGIQCTLRQLTHDLATLRLKHHGFALISHLM